MTELLKSNGQPEADPFLRGDDRAGNHRVRPQLSEEVATYLREAIIAGELSPGQSVRAETVGARLEVSATPVREALHALKVEGFLDLVPRKGFTVARLVPQDILDIFEAHALIAGELAARAAQRATADDIRELNALHLELMAAGHRSDTESLELKNHQFHRLIYRLADSARLSWALSLFTKYVPRRFYGQIEGWPATTTADHEVILEAITSQDSEAARAAMEAHIRNSGVRLAEHFARTAPEE